MLNAVIKSAPVIDDIFFSIFPQKAVDDERDCGQSGDGTNHAYDNQLYGYLCWVKLSISCRNFSSDVTMNLKASADDVTSLTNHPPLYLMKINFNSHLRDAHHWCLIKPWHWRSVHDNVASRLRSSEHADILRPNHSAAPS